MQCCCTQFRCPLRAVRFDQLEVRAANFVKQCLVFLIYFGVTLFRASCWLLGTGAPSVRRRWLATTLVSSPNCVLIIPLRGSVE